MLMASGKKGTLKGPNKLRANMEYRSLIINRVWTVVLVSVIPMILASGVILYQFRISYHEKVRAHLGTLIKKHKQNIDSFLKEKLGDILFLANKHTIKELRDEQFLKETIEALQTGFDSAFVDIGVIDGKGMQVAYAGPYKLGEAQYSTTQWFQTAMQKEYVISDVFLGLRGFPHFIIAVRCDWMGKRWILRATIDFAAFNNLVENIRLGETGFAYILNKEGKFQTNPHFDIVPEKSLIMDLLAAKSQEEIQIIEKEDNDGHKNIYVAAFLKKGDWILIYQQRSSDVFRDIRKALKITFVIILLGTLGSISLALVRVKTMANRLAEADREKELMNEQIIEAGRLASLGELAAGIAHEINNPVAIMAEEAGWIEDLLEEEEFKEGKNLTEFRRALKQIHSQGKRCKSITHKLLSFARKTDSRIQDVKVNDVIEEVVSLIAQRAKYSNVTLNLSLQKNLPLLQVSQAELQQVFLNLINNALYVLEKKGGIVSITTELKRDYNDYGGIVIEVTDDGPGISEANLSRLFDPFFTTKPVGKGTGLGLSICYGIINKMGGEIGVDSVIDEGTTFRITIPLPKDKENKK